MNIKKLLFLVLLTNLIAMPLSHAKQELTQKSDQENISAEEIAQEHAKDAQIILICQEIQKTISQQIDFMSAILQQIMGNIQKGSINIDKKNDIPGKLNTYSQLIVDLQSQIITTADPHMLIMMAIILQNVIDRLIVSVDSNLKILDFPSIEDLTIPHKNIEKSLTYLIEATEKNSIKLDKLSLKSTSLGLTFLNKAVRKAEHFCTHYKWPLLGLGATAAGFAFYQWQKIPFTMNTDEELKTNGGHYWNEVSQVIKSIISEPRFQSEMKSGIILALLTNHLTKFGDSAINKSTQWINKHYKKMIATISYGYNYMKGVKNIERDGLATNIDNVPTLYDESLIGLDDQKNEFFKILDYLRDPELYIRSDNEIAKCCILIGPSRTGKTALAKSMASTINKLYDQIGSPLKVKFIEINYLMLQNEVKLRELIAYAIESAPCILFIDEIHLLALQKNGNRELLNEFLTQLTELHKIKDPAKQVFIIAATNHPELLAPELFKHERFGKIIRFRKPGILERTHFFISSLSKYGINPESLDIESIVLQTKDCDFGHLQQIVKDARFEARSKGQGVNQEHLQKAINTLVHGVSSTIELSEDEAKIAAVDQAGKIVAHLQLKINETIHLATISKVDGKIEEDNFWISDKKDTEIAPMRYGAIVSTSNTEEIPCSDAQELEKLCKRSLAGIVAQKIILGTYYIDYSAKDYKEAFEIAQKIILKGLNLKTLPPTQQDNLFRETQALLIRYESELVSLLEQEKPLIEKIMTILVEERSITGKEINKIVQ